MIVAITTLDLIWNFNSFGLVYVLTQGGPGHSTELPMLFAYNEAFKYGEFGYAAALGDAMVVVIACLLVFYLWGRLKETRSDRLLPAEDRARTAQYVAARLLHALPRVPAALAALDLVQGRARARRAAPVADPAAPDARRTTATR